jgi:DNA-binding transcriptional LysR family regulator
MSARPIDPRLLRTFVAVAQEGNVSRAAVKLSISQPAVSLQLKELQELTHLELFSRTATGVALTTAGRALVVHAERALASLHDFASAAQYVASGVRGTLRIGTILDPEFTRLGAFLRELVLHAPDIQPHLQHGMSGTVLDRLVASQIDACYYVGDAVHDAQAAGGPPEAVAAQCLTRFSYRVIGPPGWHARLQGRAWEDIVDLPWIITPPESIHSRLLAATLGPRGLKQRGVALVDQEASMLALVRSGVGLALARDATAIHLSQSEGVALAEGLVLGTQLSFVVRKSARDMPVVEASLDAIARAWGHPEPGG